MRDRPGDRLVQVAGDGLSFAIGPPPRRAKPLRRVRPRPGRPLVGEFQRKVVMHRRDQTTVVLGQFQSRQLLDAVVARRADHDQPRGLLRRTTTIASARSGFQFSAFRLPCGSLSSSNASSADNLGSARRSAARGPRTARDVAADGRTGRHSCACSPRGSTLAAATGGRPNQRDRETSVDPVRRGVAVLRRPPHWMRHRIEASRLDSARNTLPSERRPNRPPAALQALPKLTPRPKTGSANSWKKGSE